MHLHGLGTRLVIQVHYTAVGNRLVAQALLAALQQPHCGSRTARRDERLQPAEEERALDVLDGAGDLDVARAGVGAVEGGAAAPHAFLVVEDLQAHVAGVVTGVEDEPVGVHDRRRAEVLAVGPEHGAGRRARGAQDALGGVVEALALGLAVYTKLADVRTFGQIANLLVFAVALLLIAIYLLVWEIALRLIARSED